MASELPPLMVIDSSAAAVAVSTTVLEVIPLKVAEMLVEPLPATAIASPVALMVATAGADELQVTVLVTSALLPSLKVAMALNCSVRPLAKEPLAAEIVIDSSTAAVAVSTTAFEVIPFWEAVMLVAPLPPTAVASPVALMVAAAGIEEFQVTLAVRSAVLKSE